MMMFRNLWRRKTRTLLTTTGIAIGVAAVVVLSAFGQGMASGFGRISFSASADLTVAQKEALLIMMGTIDEEIGDQISQISGVKEVVGTVVGVVQMSETPYFLVVGEEPRGFTIAHYKLVAGQPLSGRRQILLGKLTARNFKKTIGDTFRINEAGYRIVSIYETGTSLEDTGAVISLADAQRAFDKRRQVTYFQLRLDDPRRLEEVRSTIQERWDDLMVVRSGEPSKQNDMLAMYNSLGWFLGIFAILVGGLGMMNAMLMSVFERTQEIGVLRALGWKRWRLLRMVLVESLALSWLSGLAGIAIGLGLNALFALEPTYGRLLPASYTTASIAELIVLVLALGALGGLYPAWRAANLRPVEALRYE